VNRILKLVAIALLLAVIPLRALAAVTVGFCAMGQHPEMPAHADAHDASSHHPHGHAPQSDNAPDCSMCAEHCSSASFAVPAIFETVFAAHRSARIALGESFSAGFVPEHLDPPPLAL
jgi:hypothetical protein